LSEICSSKNSGNHAAALALAADLRDIPAYVVIPNNAPDCKIQNVIRYSGQITYSQPTLQSRETTTTKIMQETGAVLIHPYNDVRIIR
jgi:serine racemase